ncbi:MAG: M23 family metallopeptidase [Lachnospiraceae bacterium]
MRRYRQTFLAGILVIVAVVGMTATYKNEINQQIAKEEKEEKEVVGSIYAEQGASLEEDAEKEPEAEPVEEASITGKVQRIKPQKEKTVKVSSFSTAKGLAWPLKGNVILDYNMDHTIYFATLDQYKYHSAILISGAVNDEVKAAAQGTVVKICEQEEIGKNITIELGNGYSLIYGQLKDVQVKEGERVKQGQSLGFIAEPTKYFLVEGSHLYFKMQKEKESVNPLLYLKE